MADNPDTPAIAETPTPEPAVEPATEPTADLPQPQIVATSNPLATAPAATTTPEEGQFNIDTYESTRSIISRQIELLEEIKRKQKVFKEQMDSLFENSEAYVAAEKQAKELTKDVKEKRSTIMQSPQAKTVKMHLQDLREEKKEIEESLSGHLFDLYQSTGVTEFEGTNGEIYEYKIQAKLGAKKQAFSSE